MGRTTKTIVALAVAITVVAMISTFVALRGDSAPTSEAAASSPTTVDEAHGTTTLGTTVPEAGSDAVAADLAIDGPTPEPLSSLGSPTEPRRDKVPGAGLAPSTNPADPIGDLDDDRPVPPGLGFKAPPKPQGAPNGFGGPAGLAVEPSCSHQCITKGVAYPRGFGAELIVETSVPATLWMSAVADLDGDGTYEDSHYDWTDFDVTEHSWKLDHLEPGQTYYVMAAATDEHDHTAYVWGEFTTLSQRNVYLQVGEGEFIGGPNNVTSTQLWLGFNGPLSDVSGNQGELLWEDVPRYAAVHLWALRGWDAELCEAWTPPSASPHGSSDDRCVAWNSTSAAVDLDHVPTDRTRWNQISFLVTLAPPTGEGDALPPGYGDPRYFHFEVPVTVHVVYS